MPDPSLSAWADLIYKVGFPIFVAVYLLMRVDRILNELVQAQKEALGLMRDIRNSYYVRKD